MPARNATGIRSTIEAPQLFVDPRLELRVERSLGRLGWTRLFATAGPPPSDNPHRSCPAEDQDQRQHPGEQVEPVPRWRREYPRPVLRDQLPLDLAARITRGDPPLDVALDLRRRRRVRLRQRLARTDRA